MKVLFITFWLTLFFQGKNEFYQILASDSVEVIDAKINELKAKENSAETRAYLGTIIMKRSSFEKVIKKKIDMFKEGNTMLEGEIAANPENVEFRFLRLAVQERVPGILNYDANIETDKTFIISKYNTLSTELKQLIYNYSTKSKVLSTDELR